MAHPLKKASEIVIGKSTYRLVFDFDAIAEAEEITGKSLIAGMADINIQRPKINEVRALLFASAKAEHPQLTYEYAKTLVSQKNFFDVWLKVLEAWSNASAEPDESEEGASENPMPDQS